MIGSSKPAHTVQDAKAPKVGYRTGSHCCRRWFMLENKETRTRGAIHDQNELRRPSTAPPRAASGYRAAASAIRVTRPAQLAPIGRLGRRKIDGRNAVHDRIYVNV